MQNRPHRSPQLGMTLLEMMVTVAIIGILIALGVPSFRYMTNTNRIASEANNLLGDLQYTRSEAIKEGQSIVICASTNPTAAAPTCAAATATNWATGWLVFADVNGNGVYNSGTDVLLRVSNALNSADTLVSNGSLGLLTFNREGFAAGLTGTQYFTLHAPTTGNNWTRCLMVTIVGRTSVIPYDGVNCT